MQKVIIDEIFLEFICSLLNYNLDSAQVNFTILLETKIKIYCKNHFWENVKNSMKVTFVIDL